MVVDIYAEVINLVEQLNEHQQAALMQHLQQKWSGNILGEPLTREMIIAEHERRRAAGAFANVESLRGKYASHALDEVSPEELDDYLRQVGREWEEEMDELGKN